jgi:ATP-dependent exoDNAse (exonuclease V) beta subunit
LENSEVPLTAKGEPYTRFAKAVTSVAGYIRDGDWEEACVQTLARRAMEEPPVYDGKPIPESLLDSLRRATRVAAGQVAQDLSRRSRALQRLATDFDLAMSGRQREEGLYRFEDVTIQLGGADPLTARADLWYRLDHFGRHLLLDEFQDTSLAQWKVLEPLVQRLMAEPATDRSLVVVADPKQSIYGWRGAEPDLVRRVRTGFPLQEEQLADSYRSSPVILRFVNRIFQGLPESSIWTETEEVTSAEEWIRDFHAHRWIHESLPGHVRVVAGPREDNPQATARPRMMRRAAELVAELRKEAPGASIGVLVRHNIAVAHLVAELRSLGVPASEEGGTRPADSPAVAAVLSLLTLADHPSHTLARYHVAKTPLGTLLSFTDFRDDAAASRLAGEVRRALMVEGYGETITGWGRTLAEVESLDRRDLRRLLQLVELAHRWDPQATLRPGDFVRFAETARMEDPETASVRVMTVYQAKGLEFDTVILPELDLRLGRRRSSQRFTLAERSGESGWIQRVFPYVRDPLQPFFPEVAEAARQARSAEMRDALGVLYVALTRARHALHLLVTADGDKGPSSSKSGARLIRLALGQAEERVEQGEVLFEDGDADWYRELPSPAAQPPEQAPAATPDILLTPRPERSRFLPHRIPSSEEGGGRIDLRRVLRFDEDPARRAGLVVHDWLERMTWIEDGIPEDLQLREMAKRSGVALDGQELDKLIGRFREWLEAPRIRTLLSRASYPPDTRVRTELSFARRTAESVVRGQIDRLVLVEEAGSVRRAEVIDFKTDRVSPEDGGELSRLIDYYRPQVEAYRDAVALTRGLAPENVSGRLAFLSPGVVVDL